MLAPIWHHLYKHIFKTCWAALMCLLSNWLPFFCSLQETTWITWIKWSETLWFERALSKSTFFIKRPLHGHSCLQGALCAVSHWDSKESHTSLLWTRGRRGKTKGPCPSCSGGTLCVLVRNSSLLPFSAFLFTFKFFEWLQERSVSNEFDRKFEFCYLFFVSNMQIRMHRIIEILWQIVNKEKIKIYVDME